MRFDPDSALCSGWAGIQEAELRWDLPESVQQRGGSAHRPGRCIWRRGTRTRSAAMVTRDDGEKNSRVLFSNKLKLCYFMLLRYRRAACVLWFIIFCVIIQRLWVNFRSGSWETKTRMRQGRSNCTCWCETVWFSLFCWCYRHLFLPSFLLYKMLCCNSDLTLAGAFSLVLDTFHLQTLLLVTQVLVLFSDA